MAWRPSFYLLGRVKYCPESFLSKSFLSFAECEVQFRYHNLSLLPLLPPANGFPLFLQLQLWFLHVLYVPSTHTQHVLLLRGITL